MFLWIASVSPDLVLYSNTTSLNFLSKKKDFNIAILKSFKLFLIINKSFFESFQLWAYAPDYLNISIQQFNLAKYF